ncbi:very short patch repair endonuclease [Dongia rigui]|uniref:Very short patch repair endonuclease n=1 Tax=Dongia rigui TaxID=940149 RepID=A0ABU5E0F2_9PROT|nr:very short patch repair endonuclease [Dongia rigui]MDY0872660.1 very short patch repair endonuclease [Dongia rigui]
MVDVLTPEQRRLNMSRVRSKDTKPEWLLRRGLHRMGFRFRLHSRDLPGRPDLVFPRHKAVIFVHGCFWHGHNCSLFKLPETRQAFWQSKIDSNRKRDEQILDRLRSAGWRVMLVWECALRGPRRRQPDDVLEACEKFILENRPGIRSAGKTVQIRGAS